MNARSLETRGAAGMGLDMDVACVMLVSVSVRVSPSYLTITSEEPKTKERGNSPRETSAW